MRIETDADPSWGEEDLRDLTPRTARRRAWRRLTRRAWGLAQTWSHENPWISFTVAVTGVMAAAVVIAIILPAYKNPSSRIYTSKFGYATVLRKLHKPFPVELGRPEHRLLKRALMAEGLVRSEPIQVPIVPMGTIKSIRVREGERVTKGQLLAEIDSYRAEIKVNAAKAALVIAKAELERVKIGSAYVLQNERPQKSAILLDQAKQSADMTAELLQLNKNLAKKGWVPNSEMLVYKQMMVAAQATLREAQFSMQMAEKGQVQSLKIAEAAVEEADLALKHRTSEFVEYQVFSPTDGTVERCLVHSGEYNQDPGKPAFLVASGTWFEANYDQTTIGRVKVGDRTEVRLEAWPDRTLRGVVTWVNPFVNFDLGGPESTRPIRPTGTGSPEWPATYAVHIALGSESTSGLPIVTGLTGFSRIVMSKESTCVPREAIAAVSGGKGLIYLARGEQYETREVLMGIIDGDWVEILSGLDGVEELIIDGHQVLEPGDRVKAKWPNEKGD